jgi:hypothetical protein
MNTCQATGEGDDWERAREAVLEREGYECRFCGIGDEKHRQEHTNGLDVHHIIPRRDGGGNSQRNLVALCRSCHKTMESLHAQAMGEIVQEQDYSADLAGVNEVFSVYTELRRELDEELAEFHEGHPVFSERFGIYDWGSEQKPLIDSSVWSDADATEITTEWQFAVSWGYKEGITEAVGYLDGLTGVPFDLEDHSGADE